MGHPASGSKGSARIFRLGYDQPGYVRLATVALRLWRRLEAESGTTLVTTTGQVTFGDDLDVLLGALAEASAPYQLMRAGEVTDRFPALSVPGTAVFEPESGVIAAEACLGALRRTPGIELHERTRVLECVDDGSRVRLSLGSPGGADELRASVVVVCAGPWTAPLLAGRAAGLRPLASLEQVAYLAPADSAASELPVFVERRRPWFYGLPVRSSGLMKVSLHGGGPALSLEEIDDDSRRDRPDVMNRPDPALVAELSAAARRALPGYDPAPVDTERCVYDNSADGDFVLDRVGRLVVGAGTSGHGFKFAPLLGELLADLATGAPHDPELATAADLAPFTLARLPLTGGAGGPAVHR